MIVVRYGASCGRTPCKQAHESCCRKDTYELPADDVVELDNGVTTSIYFGEASLLATGTSEWTSVTHNAHALAPCP